LAYKVVIVPFMEEMLDHHPSLSPNLWCSMENMPVPVKYSKGLLETEFSDAYSKERLYKFIDSINTVYVAFTRPKEGLVVYAPKMADPDKESKSVADILNRYYEDFKEQSNWGAKIVIGEKISRESMAQANSKKVLQGQFANEMDMERYATVARGGTIGEGESIREHGIAMHYVFSLVDYPQSVGAAVEKACAEGVASCSREELLEMVNGKILSVKEYG
jgi:ATP-dependent exoDNAse (exonuclease V) beta subunit